MKVFLLFSLYHIFIIYILPFSFHSYIFFLFYIYIYIYIVYIFLFLTLYKIPYYSLGHRLNHYTIIIITDTKKTTELNRSGMRFLSKFNPRFFFIFCIYTYYFLGLFLFLKLNIFVFFV